MVRCGLLPALFLIQSCIWSAPGKKSCGPLISKANAFEIHSVYRDGLLEAVRTSRDLRSCDAVDADLARERLRTIASIELESWASSVQHLNDSRRYPDASLICRSLVRYQGVSPRLDRECFRQRAWHALKSRLTDRWSEVYGDPSDLAAEANAAWHFYGLERRLFKRDPVKSTLILRKD